MPESCVRGPKIQPDSPTSRNLRETLAQRSMFVCLSTGEADPLQKSLVVCLPVVCTSLSLFTNLQIALSYGLVISAYQVAQHDTDVTTGA